MNTIYHGDALTYLKTLPDEYVNCVVTSPPYFGLRDYGVEGQIGLESTPQTYIARLVEVFREVKRVLREDGVIWVNIGDSYSSGGSGGYSDKSTLDGFTNANTKGRQMNENPIVHHITNIAPKNLLGMLWRLAFALQESGWILRSDVIWHKPNPMPESVTDRPTKSHEYVFLLVKSQAYWYDGDAIREPQKEFISHPEQRPKAINSGSSLDSGAFSKQGGFNAYREKNGIQYNPLGRNKRTVWTVVTEATPFTHFATFPQKLIEPMILTGCPAKVCAVCGAPWVRQIEVSGGTGKSWHNHENDMINGQSKAVLQDGYQRIDKGFEATCDCGGETRPGIVLDMFMGSGTTALVARRLGRNYLGCELNENYLNIALERLRLPFEEHYVEPAAPKKLDDKDTKGGYTKPMWDEV